MAAEEEEEGQGPRKRRRGQESKGGGERGGEEYRRRVAMSFLSYKVVRGTCLRFPEQLEVVVAGDVFQQRLPARPVALTVLLVVETQEERDFFIYSNHYIFFIKQLNALI